LSQFVSKIESDKKLTFIIATNDLKKVFIIATNGQFSEPISDSERACETEVEVESTVGVKF